MGVVTRDDGLWDVLYEAITGGMTRAQLDDLYSWVLLDAHDDEDLCDGLPEDCGCGRAAREALAGDAE